MRHIGSGLALLLPLCAGAAWAQAEKSSAFRRDDYDTAYTFASVTGTELRPDGSAYVCGRARGRSTAWPRGPTPG